jgi:hypothetical protein
MQICWWWGRRRQCRAGAVVSGAGFYSRRVARGEQRKGGDAVDRAHGCVEVVRWVLGRPGEDVGSGDVEGLLRGEGHGEGALWLINWTATQLKSLLVDVQSCIFVCTSLAEVRCARICWRLCDAMRRTHG